MLGTVVLHTRLAERQGEIDRLEAAVTDARERFDVLRQQRAELRSPTRLAIEARDLGMVPTPRTEFLPVDPQTLAEVLAAAGIVDDVTGHDHRPRTRSTRSAASRPPTGAPADGPPSPPEHRRAARPATATARRRAGRSRTDAPTGMPAGAASTHRPVELPPRVGAPAGRRAGSAPATAARRDRARRAAARAGAAATAPSRCAPGATVRVEPRPPRGRERRRTARHPIPASGPGARSASAPAG